MILNATRGKDFREDFTFKDEKGRVVNSPQGDYRLQLEHGDFVKEYRLSKIATGVVWLLPGAEVDELEYSTLYFTLTYNGGEVTRGVLRVN